MPKVGKKKFGYTKKGKAKAKAYAKKTGKKLKKASKKYQKMTSIRDRKLMKQFKSEIDTSLKNLELRIKRLENANLTFRTQLNVIKNSTKEGE